jgi:perosamine synthetase
MKEILQCEPWFPRAYADAVRDQVLSGWLGPGPATSAFASAICEYTGAAHCLLTTSGTVALMVAATALELKPGDEILVPAYGVVSTINAFASMGLSPRLVDIDRSTGCVSTGQLAARIGPNSRAVCFVNFSGYTGGNLLEVARICQERGLPLIEDAACALGHCFQGRYAGTFGNIGTYSFSVPKVITTGQGGAVVTNSAPHYERAAAYVDQGDLSWRKTNLVRQIGTNLRYNDILASFGLAQFREIDARWARKKAAYQALSNALGDKLFRVPGDKPPLFNIVFPADRAKLLGFLAERGIRAVEQYRTLCEHPPYAPLRDGEFSNADFWNRYATYLPFGLSLEPEDGERMAKAVVESGIDLLPIHIEP